MLTLDDCSRTELKRLARYATPRQIAEAKARIAAEATKRENEERLVMCAQSVDACRAARDYLLEFGGGETYRRLFEEAKQAARRSAHAERRWRRYAATAQRLARAAEKLARSEDQ
ncbi:hypothetical protein IY145_10820 [Methylosinus sp. H3A]|uniref:hypothetical protein n=1 Tax=Methylosinus sp. H3A TaxID=2785786 RepID=UPI0018C28BDC|nr:hypothetical protein [Methylosinus sp. H3A]MBG0809871.1 hypothetical protein [Methylosinus sp. H3A]